MSLAKTLGAKYVINLELDLYERLQERNRRICLRLCRAVEVYLLPAAIEEVDLRQSGMSRYQNDVSFLPKLFVQKELKYPVVPEMQCLSDFEA